MTKAQVSAWVFCIFCRKTLRPANAGSKSMTSSSGLIVFAIVRASARLPATWTWCPGANWRSADVIAAARASYSSTRRMLPCDVFPAEVGDEYRFGQELPQNVPAACADRFADADFLGPFGNTDQHDVHDADPCGDKGDKADYERADAHDSSDVQKCAFQRVVSVHLEIIWL